MFLSCSPDEEKDDDNDDDEEEEEEEKEEEEEEKEEEKEEKEEEKEEDEQWYIHVFLKIFLCTNRPSFRYKEDQFSLSKTMELQILSIFWEQ